MKDKYQLVINMVFCSKCGSENNDLNEKCEKCGELLVKKEYFKTKSYNDFKDIFSNENYNALDELTVERYNTVIENIKEMGHYYLKEYYANTSINKRQMSTLDKIKTLTQAYTKISYKSSSA